MSTGTVKWFSDGKGYGFITGLTPGKHRVTVHVTWPDGTIVTEATSFTVAT